MTPEDLVHELPDGQLVCREHLLIYCGKCCVDFTFMVDDFADDDDHQDELEEDDAYEIEQPSIHQGFFRLDDSTDESEEPSIRMGGYRIPSPPSDEDDFGMPKIKRGTGRVLPTTFKPPTPSATPMEVFRADNTRLRMCRYVHRKDPTQGLIFTDGACLDNGRAHPRAGWGFVSGPRGSANGVILKGGFKGRLETEGPFGEEGAQTSNRAELRAVIAALGFRAWSGEGFKTMVFATDSSYVVDGATKWVKKWLKNGWKTSLGASVKNQDLWEMLLGEVERLEKWGVKVQFWRIGRELNTEADFLAKAGAMESDINEFTPLFGVAC